MKARSVLFSVLVLLSLVLAACQPAATTEPAAPTTGAAEPTMAAVEPTATTAAEEPTEAAVEPTATTAAEEPTEATGAGEQVSCEDDAFGCAEIPAGETIKIGMGAPMTGDNSPFGIDISQAAQIAIEDAGELEGFSFELVVEDDGGTPEGGAAVANKLVSDPTVVAIAGHIFSGATDAAMPIYEELGIPMMSPSATNPPLTQKGSKVFNRVAFTDAVQGQLAAEYVFNTLGFTKAAVMHDGQAYGQGLAEVFAENFEKLGGEVVATEAVTPGETDYTAPLSAIAAKGPEVLYYGGYVQDAVVLVNQMAQSGLEGVTFFGCDGTFGADFVDRTGDNGEGAYSVALVAGGSEPVETFNATYLEKFGKEAGSLSPYSWNAYDSAAVLIDAIKKVAFLGDNGSLMIPRGALVETVRNTKDFQGLSGVLTCDETGECNSSGPIFYIDKGGEWVRAEE